MDSNIFINNYQVTFLLLHHTSFPMRMIKTIDKIVQCQSVETIEISVIFNILSRELVVCSHQECLYVNKPGSCKPRGVLLYFDESRNFLAHPLPSPIITISAIAVSQRSDSDEHG